MGSDIVRVACLYRVSTKAQVDRFTDDIPMQKNACAEFIKSKTDWELKYEYIEKGISGYKKSAESRDVLQQIKSDAENKRFDALLVFMFDRLGRREDETPFIIEWFVSQGIEVWSVKEGQQRFDNRADKLLNYIRYWTSGGESEKTGIRVKEKHTQMIKEGKYCGGIAPYGYELISSGLESSKGRLLKKMVINEEESEIVKLIYRLATERGYGGHRIAKHLNEKNIPTRKNSKWGLSVINYMLRNPIYKGYPTYGKTTAKTGTNRRLSRKDWFISEIKVGELAIIPEKVWEKAQLIRNARTPLRFKPEAAANTPNYPRQTNNSLLFTGLVLCGHCGSTMCSYSSVSKWKTKEGVKSITRPSYRCTSANRGIRCGGQMSYIKERIEEPVLAEIYTYLDTLSLIGIHEKINKAACLGVKKEENSLRKTKNELDRLNKNLDALKDEVIRVINGESAFGQDLLQAVIDNNERKKSELKKQLNILERQMKQKQQRAETLMHCPELIPSLKKEFDNADIGIKKMLIYELIDVIIVRKDILEVYFKITFEDFRKSAGNAAVY